MKRLSSIAILLFLTCCLPAASVLAAEPTKLRLGWQVPWATQGQLVQILKHTDIAKKHQLEIQFIGRTYGPELNEAALAGQVDAILTADQPAAALFTASPNWRGVGRLMYNRTTTYVPNSSPITSMADLKGKTIGVPIGAAAERILVESLRKAGLDPKRDVKIVNLGMAEHAPLIKRSDKGAATWGQFDALAGFDPIPAILEANGLVRTVDAGKVVSMVLMNQRFMKENPEAAKRFMSAIAEAYLYYSKNRDQADSWFLAESRLADGNHQACRLAASIEPNLVARSPKEIRTTFTEDDFLLMQKGADFLAEKTKKNIRMRDYILN